MYFAEIDKNNIVLRVIVADQAFINSGAVGSPAKWVQTAYDALGGVYKDAQFQARKNYAGIGYTYDKTRDAFIPPKPDDTFVLNEQTCLWVKK